MRHNHIIPGHHTPSTELWQTHAPPVVHHPQSLQAFHHTEQPHQCQMCWYFRLWRLIVCRGIWSIWWQSSSSGWIFLLRADKPLWQSCHLSKIQLVPIWLQFGEALRCAFTSLSGYVSKEKPHCSALAWHEGENECDSDEFCFQFHLPNHQIWIQHIKHQQGWLEATEKGNPASLLRLSGPFSVPQGRPALVCGA